MLKKIPYRYRVLVLLCTLCTITYLDRICISIVGVRIKSEFDLTNTEFGFVLAAFSLAYALFEIPSGILGDRIGPRKVFIRIVLLWSVFTALTGLTTGLISLIIVRFLFGIGESGTYPNVMIVISRWFPIKETGRALTWVGLGSQIGSAIAPLIILPLAVSFSWRASFFVNALIGLIWVIICYSFFKDFPGDAKNISSGERELIETESRHNKMKHHIKWKIILINRNVWALMLMYFCCQWANYFFVAWMPVYLQEGRHFSENEMKFISTSLFIAGIAGFLIGGVTSDWIDHLKGIRFGRRFMGISGLGLCGLFLLAASLSSNNHISSNSLILANFFFCFGVMVSYAVCADIGKSNTGTVTGAMNFFGQTGAFVLALAFGKIADMTHNFNYPLILVGFVMIMGALLWIAIDPLKQIKEEVPH